MPIDFENIPQEILLRAVISKNMKTIRKRQKMTQETLAKNTGINRVTIAKYETCKIGCSLWNLLIIAKGLNANIEELLNGWEEIF